MMSIPLVSALVAYVLTIACACVLARRSSNRRIRLLAFTIALVPLCQGVILLGDNKIWVSPIIRDTAQSMELLVNALCLAAVYLLGEENRERKDTDTQLRVLL
jgi:hypothetical protein